MRAVISIAHRKEKAFARRCWNWKAISIREAVTEESPNPEAKVIY